MEYDKLIQQNLRALQQPNLTIDAQNNHYKNIGFYYYSLKNIPSALTYFLKIEPKDFSTLRSIAGIYAPIDMNKSIVYTELCLEQQYDNNVAYDLACNYTKMCKFGKACNLYKIIIVKNPTYVNAYNNYADLLGCFMEQTSALKMYEHAYSLDTSRMDIYSNILMTGYYIPSYSHKTRYDYARKFDTLNHVSPEKQMMQKTINPQKLRIGYIGYDFNKPNHPISCFVNHIFENHSKTFDVYCYQVSSKISSLFQPKHTDELYTSTMKGVRTRDLSTFSDEMAAAAIHMDQIDILVELMHHTAGNRLRILAYKPAPIQISYCAFPGTSGMKSLEYKIIDTETGTKQNQNYSSETLIMMPNGFHCFSPRYEFPAIKLFPPKNIVNLCCFNNAKKLNMVMIELWIHILRRVPFAHLYLRYYQYSDPAVVNFYTQQFQKIAERLYVKLDMKRIHFIGYVPDYSIVLSLYNNMHLFLDTWPYNGTTVLCEALTMGVPVITLKGKGIHERIGASILASINKRDWIATNRHDYIEKAVSMCNHPGLKMIRKTLPTHLKTTIVGNPLIFIKEYEETLMNIVEKHISKTS
jgi:protein O-GlcNAc transferase